MVSTFLCSRPSAGIANSILVLAAVSSKKCWPGIIAQEVAEEEKRDETASSVRHDGSHSSSIFSSGGMAVDGSEEDSQLSNLEVRWRLSGSRFGRRYKVPTIEGAWLRHQHGLPHTTA